MTSKWERREAKQRAERGRIPRHGGTLATIYANAVSKRSRNQKKNKKRKR